MLRLFPLLRIYLIVATIFGVTGFASFAVQAADTRPYSPVDPPPVEEPVEWGSGWYLRGDIGWSFDSQPQIGATLTYTGLTPTRQAWVGDLGVGHRHLGAQRLGVDRQEPHGGRDGAQGVDPVLAGLASDGDAEPKPVWHPPPDVQKELCGPRRALRKMLKDMWY